MMATIKGKCSFLLKVMVIGVSLAVAASAVASAGPTKVPGSDQAKKLVKKVAPAYPPEAKEKGISGLVRLEAIIAKDGTVKELNVISGDDALIPSAVKAVKQWVYEPTMLNGEAVEVQTQVDVNYSLSK